MSWRFVKVVYWLLIGLKKVGKIFLKKLRCFRRG